MTVSAIELEVGNWPGSGAELVSASELVVSFVLGTSAAAFAGAGAAESIFPAAASFGIVAGTEFEDATSSARNERQLKQKRRQNVVFAASEIFMDRWSKWPCWKSVRWPLAV